MNHFHTDLYYNITICYYTDQCTFSVTAKILTLKPSISVKLVRVLGDWLLPVKLRIRVRVRVRVRGMDDPLQTNHAHAYKQYGGVKSCYRKKFNCKNGGQNVGWIIPQNYFC